MSVNENINNQSFEDAMKRLDEITAELSREGVSLDDALALYEEGVRLARECNAKLEDTERKIKMLQVAPDGEISEKDVDPVDNN